MKCPYAKDHQISTKCSIEYDEEKTIQTSWEQIEIDIISFGGATVRCRKYSRWEADTVRSSQPPLSSLGAKAVR